MDADRLAELQRQRDLVRSHLAWLEREIAISSAPGTPKPESTGGASPAIAKSDAATPPFPTASGAPFTNSPPDPLGSATDAKRGCLIFAAIALVLGLLGLVALYFLRYNGRPLF